jgi:hypothetical protein
MVACVPRLHPLSPCFQITSVLRRPEDQLLIMASDGLWVSGLWSDVDVRRLDVLVASTRVHSLPTHGWCDGSSATAGV